MNTTDVLTDLDELIESLRGSADAEYSTDSASPSPNADMKTLVTLTTLRERLAALVEAARPFDRASLFAENSAYMNASVTVKVGQLRKLELALKAIGHG